MCAELGLVVLLLAAGCGAPSTPAPPRELSPPAAVPPPMGRLVGVVGDVRLRRAGEVGWTSAEPGTALHAGDAVQTMAGARAVVAYEGHAEGELEESTMIVIPERSGPDRRLSQLSGRLIARLGPGEGRLEVELPPGLLSIERPSDDGTIEAHVEVDESRTEIEMRHGRGLLTRTRGAPLAIEPDRFATLAPDGTVLHHGLSRGAIELIAPEHDAVVRTRSEVTLRWSTIDGVGEVEARVEDDEGHVVVTERGERVATVRLGAGRYRWTVLGELEGEELRSGDAHPFVVEIDREAPRLVLSAPLEGAAIDASTLRVAGRTEPGARVEVDGALAAVDADGAFSYSRPLPRGLSHLVVHAWDALGNDRVVTRSVVRP